MLKAMIVDDEAPARSELKFLLDELGQTEVVAEAASVREAIEKLKEYPCDVMFLDVNMPEATGLQLAEALQHLKFPPAVVFVTAYSEFALDAFKVNAIDTSGAGDAYIGCFACCYVQTGDILSSMKTASAFAALSVTKRGTQKSYPEKEDVLKLLKE